jgi:PAS domain S-box-containing protein
MVESGVQVVEAVSKRVNDLRQRIAAQAREINELKAELAVRRGQYRAVIEHNPRPTWVYSPESLQFLDVNHVAVHDYGWSRDQFLSMTIADIRPVEDVPRLLADVDEMRGRSGGISGPWRHRHRDGTVVEVVISAISIPFVGRAARMIMVDSMVREGAEDGCADLDALSPRERQVFGMVARGHTSQEIATQLRVSSKSVETYRARFMAKLGL